MERKQMQDILNYGFCLDDNDTSEYLLTVGFNETYPLFD